MRNAAVDMGSREAAAMRERLEAEINAGLEAEIEAESNGERAPSWGALTYTGGASGLASVAEDEMEGCYHSRDERPRAME